MNEARGRRTWRRGVACAGVLALAAVATLSTGCVTRGPVIEHGGEYGATTDGRRKRAWVHRGEDYMKPKGAPVLAPADGEVVNVSRWRGQGSGHSFCGVGFNIFHEGEAEGLMTRLCHLDTLDVDERQRVKRGEKVGTVGTTGCRYDCPPHLHFEVWVGGTHVKPSTRIAGCIDDEETQTSRARPLTYPVRC